VGYATAADGSLVAAFAAPGDTDLDGIVNIADLQTILASGKYGTGSAAIWSDGDFNYDGVVSIADLQDLLAAGVYGQITYLPTTGGSLLGSLAVRSPLDLLSPNGGGLAGFDSGEAPLLVAVPEPSGCLIAAQAALVAMLACLRRRRI